MGCVFNRSLGQRRFKGTDDLASQQSMEVLAVVLAIAALASPFGRRLVAMAATAETGWPDWHVVSVSSLRPSTVCTASEGSSSNSSALTVVHRHGPCSPLLSRSAAPSPAETLHRDRDRSNSILSKITVASATNSSSRASKRTMRLPAHWATASLGTNNYVVTVGLGTPARHFTVEFDTSSDLSWVQCKPCNDCYKQHDPLFDPARSPTYSTVPCGAPECRDRDLLRGCSSSSSSSANRSCQFDVLYADGSQTTGDLARDTLTLTPTDTIQGLVFGCGHKSGGTTGFGTEDGLIGLGRKSVSLASQLASRSFSYCLPSQSSGAGYLAFGGASSSPPANVQYTAMLPNQDFPSLYYIRLVGIKVAGKLVKIPAASMLVDSATQLTNLPDGAFAAVWAAFARLMAMGRYRRAPGLSFLDTCYNFTGHAGAAMRISAVALVFAGGVTVNLDLSGVLVRLGPGVECLGLTSTGDDKPVGILGNTQQKTFAVVYDVANHRMGFAAKGCA